MEIKIFTNSNVQLKPLLEIPFLSALALLLDLLINLLNVLVVQVIFIHRRLLHFLLEKLLQFLGCDSLI